MIDFRIERGWSFDGYRLWIISYQNNKTYIAKPFLLEFVELPECEKLPEPSLEISGMAARELLPAIQKSLAGLDWTNKEDIDIVSRIQKAMQSHIDSLKFVLDRTLKND